MHISIFQTRTPAISHSISGAEAKEEEEAEFPWPGTVGGHSGQAELFRARLSSYYTNIERVSRELLDAMAAALGLPAHFFRVRTPVGLRPYASAMPGMSRATGRLWRWSCCCGEEASELAWGAEKDVQRWSCCLRTRGGLGPS